MDLKVYLEGKRERVSRTRARLKVLGYGFLTGLIIFGYSLYVSHRDRQIIEYYSQCASYQEAIDKLNIKLLDISQLSFEEREKVIADYNHFMQLYTSKCDMKYILGD